MTKPRLHTGPSLAPRYVRRREAAAYCSVSESKFQLWVQEGRMEPGFTPDGEGLGHVRLWDLSDVDASMQAMKLRSQLDNLGVIDGEEENEENEWDQAIGGNAA